MTEQEKKEQNIRQAFAYRQAARRFLTLDFQGNLEESPEIERAIEEIFVFGYDFLMKKAAELGWSKGEENPNQ